MSGFFGGGRGGGRGVKVIISNVNKEIDIPNTHIDFLRGIELKKKGGGRSPPRRKVFPRFGQGGDRQLIKGGAWR